MKNDKPTGLTPRDVDVDVTRADITDRIVPRPTRDERQRAEYSAALVITDGVITKDRFEAREGAYATAADFARSDAVIFGAAVPLYSEPNDRIVGDRPRLAIVPKSDEERATLGIGPGAGRWARVRSRIARAARWLWVGSIVIALGACVVEATDPAPRPALGRACEPDYPDVVERCRFEAEPAGECGGFCNIACSSSSTCPDGASCDLVGGGACRWPCAGPADCPDLDVARCDRGFCTAGIDL